MAKVLIVGAGAAGLMAAGAAVRQGHQVTVLEHMDKPGQKILVTGKGRCNVTNDCPAEEFLRHVRTNPRFLYSSLGAFPPAKTMELFEDLGVELKVERGRRVFPVSAPAAIRPAAPAPTINTFAICFPPNFPIVSSISYQNRHAKAMFCRISANYNSWARMLFCTMRPAGVRARVRPSKLA